MKNGEEGQMLVSLIFFVVITLIITSALTVVLFNIHLSTSRYSDGLTAYYTAQTGVENTFIRLVRNPFYSGETFPVGEGQAVTQVIPGTPIKVISTGTYYTSTRKIEADLVYNQGVITIQSLKEIF